MHEHLLANAPETSNEEDFVLQHLVQSRSFWKHVLSYAFLGGLLGLGLFYVLPRIYVAEAVLMAPVQADRLNASALSGGSSALGALAMAGGGASALFKDPNSQYIAMLKSRTVSNDIIQNFNLLTIWKLKNFTLARRKLDSVVSIKSTKEMLLSISVEDHNPKLAADIANALVKSLQTQSRKMSQTLAKQKYAFYQEQFNHAARQLASTETQVRDLQKKNSALRVDDQTRLALESVARLQARTSSVQVELIAAQHYAGPDNQDVQRLQAQLAALKSELAQQQAGQSGIMMPLNNLPDAQVAYLRTVREYRYAEIVYELLAKQLESARIEESSDGIWLQVLDEAIPPELPESPKRSICTLTGLFTGLLCAVAWAIFRPVRFLPQPKNDLK